MNLIDRSVPVFLAGILAISPGIVAAQDSARAVPGGQTQAQAETRSLNAPASFAQLAREKLPSVVNVAATQRAVPSEGPGIPGIPGIPGLPDFQLPPGSPFEDFFDRFAPPDMDDRPQNALGSGFIIDSSGYIVTNNHMVEQADEVMVILSDDTELPAEVIGRDSLTDLALLKVETERELPAVSWGDSDEAEVGDWVLAIGNPFGLGGTVTSGIISARARQINAGPYDDFLQTDASINRGNSGGPLFDMQGRVIGVNTAIFSPSGGSVGIGFAIPSAIAQSVIQQLRERGEVVRGYLGVQIQPVSPDIAEALGLDEAEGALVADVMDGSPAAEAGIEPGDVILRFGDRNVAEPRQLSRAVAATEVGVTREIEVLRDGERQTLDVKVAQLDPEGVLAEVEEQVPETTGGPLGLELSEINPASRRQFGLQEDAEGVVVVDVAPGSAAAEHGFRPGDVIRRVGGTEVGSVDDVREAVEQAREGDRNSILVLRERNGNSSFAALPLEGGDGQVGEGADDRG